MANQWQKRKAGPHKRGLAALALLLATTSCLPDSGNARLEAVSGHAVSVKGQPLAAADFPAPPPAALDDSIVAPTEAFAANQAIPLASGPNYIASAFHIHARSFGDELRALDCLSEAVYYEARSESEDGQRAVAQVVLNRVRHPSYPNSICGIVYQGPMRVGGGCQFSFTCDGSLARRPVEPGWSRARRIAAEALAGTVYAPVGLATHYHSFAVLPRWASSLEKAAVIGAHIFYRWAGGAGQPASFRQSYAGREAGPRLWVAPAAMPAAATYAQASAPSLPYSPPRDTAWVPAPSDNLPQVDGSNLPISRVREEYRNAGSWRVATK